MEQTVSPQILLTICGLGRLRSERRMLIMMHRASNTATEKGRITAYTTQIGGVWITRWKNRAIMTIKVSM